MGSYKISCKFDNENTFHTVEDTTFLVYDKSSISYSSVSPIEIPMKSAVVAHLTGVGFVNTTDLACVSQEGHVFRATFNNATSVSCSIPSTRKSGRLHLALSFSRADQTVTDGKSVNFTIFAHAPQPTSAKFTNSLQGILVSFDFPSKSRINSEDCNTFFESADVPKFGSWSKCKFRTPTTMVIELLGRPKIAPSDIIQFKLTSIEQKFQKVTKQSSQQLKRLVVAVPPNPVVPKAVLTGSSVLGR